MAVTINGTTGIITPALENDGITTVAPGSAAAPAITTDGDTNTGIFFPAADTIAFSEGGAEAMRIDSSGNVGIGTSSPNAPLNVVGAQTTFDTNVFGQVLVRSTAAYNATPRAGIVFSVKYNSAGDYIAGGSSIQGYKQTANNGEFANGLLFTTQAEGSAPAERARIDSSGNLLVGTTSTIGTNGKFYIVATGGATNDFYVTKPSVNQYYNPAIFLNNAGTNVGYIQCSTTATTYSTSSDYRLKHDIEPMTGALAKVAQLKPVTYKWNSNNSTSQGFIAHELQAVIPDAVVGEKDAVDAEGNPQYQGIDTSFLVATLTAAIQELKAEVDALKGAQA